MTFDFEQKMHIGLLRLHGELTGHNIREMRKALLIALSNTDHVIVDFAGVLKIDRSFADHFKHTRAVSRRLGKKMTPVNISQGLGSYSLTISNGGME